jgi:protein phosphatase
MRMKNDFHIEFAALSDIGLRRKENQDSYFAPDATPLPLEGEHEYLFIVADGMGGHARGREASETAIRIIVDRFSKTPEGDVPTRLKHAIEDANDEIYNKSRDQNDIMGTTCTVFAIHGDRASIAHVGDSRIYRLRNYTFEQLTQDHSEVAQLVQYGKIAAKEASTHPRRSVLTRALGASATINIDILDMLKLTVGDKFVLCTDGLYKIPQKQLSQVVAKQEPQDAVKELVRLANKNGGQDNITCIILSIKNSKPRKKKGLLNLSELYLKKTARFDFTSD